MAATRGGRSGAHVALAFVALGTAADASATCSGRPRSGPSSSRRGGSSSAPMASAWRWWRRLWCPAGSRGPASRSRPAPSRCGWPRRPARRRSSLRRRLSPAWSRRSSVGRWRRGRPQAGPPAGGLEGVFAASAALRLGGWLLLRRGHAPAGAGRLRTVPVTRDTPRALNPAQEFSPVFHAVVETARRTRRGRPAGPAPPVPRAPSPTPVGPSAPVKRDATGEARGAPLTPEQGRPGPGDQAPSDTPSRGPCAR